jgi:hypothetical protein
MPPNMEFRDLVAFLPLLAAIFTYSKTSSDRLKRALRARKNYGLGFIYTLANVWPHRFHAAVTLLIMLASLDYIAIKFFDGIKNWPDIGPWLFWIYEHYWYFFIGWIVCVILAFFQVIERTAVFLLGGIRGCRESIGWANANWHVPDDTTQPAPVLAPSEDGLNQMADQVINGLVGEKPNPNLALRPASLDNAVAANILYFGHVIEANAGGKRFPWTPFYEALAEVSRSPDHPFNPDSLARFDRASASFLDDVLMRMNDHLGNGCPKLESLPGLEEHIKNALGVLQESFDSDARNTARGWVRKSYNAILDNAEAFLEHEEMRRQFAKLMAIWQVVDRLHRPDAFKVPFSGGIFLMYLNSEVLLTDSERFSRDDLGVQLCFEETQRRLMQKVRSLLDGSHEQTRKNWREEQEEFVKARGIDWQWWMFYRSDQHTYHLGRDYEQKPWKAVNSYALFTKAKS